MAKINLLPWREELRKKKQQDFISGVGLGILLVCLLLIVVYMYIEGLKEFQERRNKMIQDEITILDKRIQEIKDIEEKKNKLLTKIDVIQKLQESRPEVVHLFDELTKITPDGVYITKFTQTGTLLSMDGKAESNARVSAFMRTIDNSPWLNSAVLGVIKGQGKNNLEMNDFSLTAKLGKAAEKPKAGAK
jgi:type IV pilus assembly protein PilN